jgi:hypothetical protein
LTSILRSRLGISPIIVTVILTAVGVVIAIAVMLWASGLTGTFTNYEKLEVSSQACSLENGHFKIKARLRNTGGSAVQISSILVNNVPMNTVEGAGLSWVSERGESGEGLPIPLRTGVNVDVELTLPYGASFDSGVLTSGITVSISFRSSSGIDYKLSVELP